VLSTKDSINLFSLESGQEVCHVTPLALTPLDLLLQEAGWKKPNRDVPSARRVASRSMAASNVLGLKPFAVAGRASSMFSFCVGTNLARLQQHIIGAHAWHLHALCLSRGHTHSRAQPSVAICQTNANAKHSMLQNDNVSARVCACVFCVRVFLADFW